MATVSTKYSSILSLALSYFTPTLLRDKIVHNSALNDCDYSVFYVGEMKQQDLGDILIDILQQQQDYFEYYVQMIAVSQKLLKKLNDFKWNNQVNGFGFINNDYAYLDNSPAIKKAVEDIIKTLELLTVSLVSKENKTIQLKSGFDSLRSGSSFFCAEASRKKILSNPSSFFSPDRPSSPYSSCERNIPSNFDVTGFL
jgi:hypothetical protein